MPAERRRRVWSLRRRLLAWLLVATGVMGTAALIDTWIEARRTADQLADRVLAGSALVIAERASLSDQGLLDVAVPYGALEMLSSAAQDRVFYRVDTPDSRGRLVTGYGDLPVAGARPGGPPVFLDALFRGVPVRITSLSRAVSTGIDEVPFTVTMAETTLAREALSRDILLRSALRLAGMILGAAGIVWIAVTLSLRPLARLSEAIEARNPGDLRPLDTRVPAEVQAPMRAVNALMRRLEAALEGLRNFTGNAAHQLRTPMTVIRTELALVARAGDPQRARAALARAESALTRAERVLAQLLALARVDADAAQGMTPDRFSPLDLTPLLRDLTAEHIPAAAEAGVDLGFEPGDSATVMLARAEPMLLQEAVHNLISNAVLYGGSGAVVTLRLARRNAPGGAEILIEVEDDGPGIAAPDQAAVLSRFRRGRGAEQPHGMGLGLPVVREIAGLFGGRLELLHPGATGRGLRARIILPAIAPPEGPGRA